MLRYWIICWFYVDYELSKILKKELDFCVSNLGFKKLCSVLNILVLVEIKIFYILSGNRRKYCFLVEFEKVFLMMYFSGFLVIGLICIYKYSFCEEYFYLYIK